MAQALYAVYLLRSRRYVFQTSYFFIQCFNVMPGVIALLTCVNNGLTGNALLLLQGREMPALFRRLFLRDEQVGIGLRKFFGARGKAAAGINAHEGGTVMVYVAG